ncbi:MAG TPA: hypothetical protein DC009_06610 [Porphyromonadaceae bacterium]|nr:hypothetical protein [Porphyromonadaceae bacterium]
MLLLFVLVELEDAVDNKLDHEGFDALRLDDELLSSSWSSFLLFLPELFFLLLPLLLLPNHTAWYFGKQTFGGCSSIKESIRHTSHITTLNSHHGNNRRFLTTLSGCIIS